jgi:RNA polymerase sigma-70 factor (ECF subfamily)
MIGLILLAVASTTHLLIDRALAGERKAFDALAQKLLPPMRATIRFLLGRRRGRLGPYDGDDLVQEIWLLLWRDDGRRLKAYDPSRGASLETYVSLVTRTAATNLLAREQAERRGKGKVHTDIADAHALSGTDDPEEHVLTADLRRRLWAHLQDALGPRGLLVLKFVYEDGLSVAETARAMGAKPQVVYNWQHKIRGLIRDFMAEA